jgi:putative transposase
MCHVLGVKSNNFSGFHKQKVNTADEPTHQQMIALIKDIAKFSDNAYGVRRIKKVLNTLSLPVS